MKANGRITLASRLALAVLCVTTAAAGARAAVKIKTRQTSQGQSSENTTYIKGKRARTEMSGGQMITIQECDLRRDIQIMPQAKMYTIHPYDASGAAQTTTQTAGAVSVSVTR